MSSEPSSGETDVGIMRLIRAVTSSTGPRREHGDELACQIAEARHMHAKAVETNKEALQSLLEELVSQMHKRG